MNGTGLTRGEDIIKVEGGVEESIAGGKRKEIIGLFNF